jgi:hypothetical protein
MVTKVVGEPKLIHDGTGYRDVTCKLCRMHSCTHNWNEAHGYPADKKWPGDKPKTAFGAALAEKVGDYLTTVDHRRTVIDGALKYFEGDRELYTPDVTILLGISAVVFTLHHKVSKSTVSMTVELQSMLDKPLAAVRQTWEALLAESRERFSRLIEGKALPILPIPFCVSLYTGNP